MPKRFEHLDAQAVVPATSRCTTRSRSRRSRSAAPSRRLALNALSGGVSVSDDTRVHREARAADRRSRRCRSTARSQQYLDEAGVQHARSSPTRCRCRRSRVWCPALAGVLLQPAFELKVDGPMDRLGVDDERALVGRADHRSTSSADVLTPGQSVAGDVSVRQLESRADPERPGAEDRHHRRGRASTSPRRASSNIDSITRQRDHRRAAGGRGRLHRRARDREARDLNQGRGRDRRQRRRRTARRRPPRGRVTLPIGRRVRWPTICAADAAERRSAAAAALAQRAAGGNERQRDVSRGRIRTGRRSCPAPAGREIFVWRPPSANQRLPAPRSRRTPL